MKQLQSSKPLCYMLPNSEKVTALPYIDEQIPEQKNRIQYLIKSEQQNMQFNQNFYLQQLKMPDLHYLNSEQFENEVARIKERLEAKKQSKQSKDNKDKLVRGLLDELNISLLTKNGKLSEQNLKKIQKAALSYQNNITKQSINYFRQINLQLYQKLGPFVQKQYISALDKKKQLLIAQIEKQKQAIQKINKQRQYSQIQAKERQKTIKDRLNVMIYKKKKIQ